MALGGPASAAKGLPGSGPLREACAYCRTFLPADGVGASVWVAKKPLL